MKQEAKLKKYIIFLTLFLMIFAQIQIAYGMPTATISLTHTNTSPKVNEFDTIKESVSWKEMIGYDAYVISFVLYDHTKSDVVDYYDDPDYYINPFTYDITYSWLFGYFPDYGENNLCWLKVKYTSTGDYRVRLKFEIYKIIAYINGWPVYALFGSWYTTSTWTISSAGQVFSDHHSPYYNNIATSYTSYEKTKIKKFNLLEKYTLFELSLVAKYALDLPSSKVFLNTHSNNSIYISADMQTQYFIIIIRSKSPKDSLTLFIETAIVDNLMYTKANITIL